MASVQDPSMTEGRIDQFLGRLIDSAKAWRAGDKRSRENMIAACFGMIHELETPGERFVRLTWEEPCQLAAVQTAVDLHLFHHLNAGGTPKSTAQLAGMVNADPALLTRLLRVLASGGIIREVGPGRFASTPMSTSLETSDTIAAMNLMTSFSVPGNLKTPAFLRETEYQNPTSMFDTPMQLAHGGKGESNCFQLLHKSGQEKDFESMMKVWTKDLIHWSNDEAGYYPFKDRLVNGARKGEKEIFLIDIGGGQGNDLLKLLALHPNQELPGRLVLQDLPQLIESIPPGSLPSHIQTMSYDFFTSQPIKGARTYFLHNVVHDLSDDRAKRVLRNIADAMEPGYSKLIIWDFALQDQGVSPFVATMDWQMLTYIAGRERTEQDWKALIEDPEVGLKLTGIGQYSQFDQAVIEAELP